MLEVLKFLSQYGNAMELRQFIANFSWEKGIGYATIDKYLTTLITAELLRVERDESGRYIIKFTEKGLKALEEAVKK